MARTDSQMDAYLLSPQYVAPKTGTAALLDQANAAIATTKANIAATQASIMPTIGANTLALQAKQATEAANRAAASTANPLLNKAEMPTDAPPGTHYTWIGGTTTGSWKLYKDAPGTTSSTSSSINPASLAKVGSNIFQMLGGILYFSGVPFTGTEGGKTYKNGIEVKPEEDASGTDGTGGVTGTSTTTTTKTGPTLASDVFKQTLAIFFGPAEMAKPWANELYNIVSKFYKQGATSEEAFNMAVLDSRNNPALAEFTKRFKGIYGLQDMKQAGKAVTVPTIAEYFATESKMGDILKQSNLGDLANEDFLGDVLGKGVSATEFANRITAIFDRIDNAPKNIKDTISRYFPTVDRISLAKAIALGDKGAKELQAQVAGYEVLSAAEKQGLSAGQLVGGTTVENAYQYALGGETYDTALTKFGTVAAMLPTVNKLTQVYGEETLGQAGVESAVFGKSAKEIKRLEDLAKKEEASFSGRSGVSQISLASQRRGAGLI